MSRATAFQDLDVLEPSGGRDRQAECIAFAWLHSRVFSRAQWSRFLDTHSITGSETVPGIGGIDRVCRILSRRIYRALGVEDIRYRRTASEAVLMGRACSRSTT